LSKPVDLKKKENSYLLALKFSILKYKGILENNKDKNQIKNVAEKYKEENIYLC